MSLATGRAASFAGLLLTLAATAVRSDDLKDAPRQAWAGMTRPVRSSHGR